MNHLIADMISMSTSFRIGPKNSMHNFQRLANHLIPFPRLHFITMNLAPINLSEQVPQQEISQQEIMKTALNMESTERVFCAATFLRGNFDSNHYLKLPKEVSLLSNFTQISQLQIRKDKRYAPWLPCSHVLDHWDFPPYFYSRAALTMKNSSGIDFL